MQKVFLLGLLVLLPLVVFYTQPTSAEAPIIPEQPKPPSVEDLVVKYANEYKVSSSVMNAVIKCESNYNTTAHNSVGENSWGLVQINLNAHTTITVAQATDPDFAISFLARELSQGNGRIWTCWRKLAIK